MCAFQGIATTFFENVDGMIQALSGKNIAPNHVAVKCLLHLLDKNVVVIGPTREMWFSKERSVTDDTIVITYFGSLKYYVTEVGKYI